MNKSDVNGIRKEVKQYLDHADEKMIRMIHAMLEVDASTGWWETMPNSIKDDVETAISQADKGEVIRHEEIKKKYPQWFTR